MTRHGDGGFTLVEIMIVVAVVGLLAAIAIPSFQKARQLSRISAYANDLRQICDAFEIYAMENRSYPPNGMRGVAPPGTASYLPKRFDFTKPTPLGGSWDWDNGTHGITAGMSASGTGMDGAEFQELDKKIDDGDLTKGKFQFLDDRYTWLVVP